MSPVFWVVSKKSVTPITVISLLLLVGVMNFQNWFSEFQQDVLIPYGNMDHNL